MATEATPENSETTRFDALPRVEQDRKREEATPDDLHDALDVQTNHIATQLDALGPDSRNQTTGKAGVLRRELDMLTSSRAAVGLWERETATKRGVGEKTPSFTSFIAGLTEAAEADRLPPTANMSIIDAASWLSGSYYRNVTEVFTSQDDAKEADRQELAQELEEQLRQRSKPEQETILDPMKTEAEQQARQSEARTNIEHAALLHEILTVAENNTYILTDLPGGFTMKAGDNPDHSSAPRHINFNDRIIKALDQVHQAAPGWTRIPTEAVAFTPVRTVDTTLERTERTVKTGLFKTEKRIDTREVDVPGSEHALTMVNPATGESEPVVLFQYSFSDQGKINPDGQGGNLRYREFRGSRGGNELKVALEMPQSLADSLKSAIKDNPELVRNFVKNLALKRSNGAITQELWDHGNKESGNPVEPPYNDLPSNWEISVFDSKDFAIDTTRTYNQRVRTFGDKTATYTGDQLQLAA
jgi:hypothetical protein